MATRVDAPGIQECLGKVSTAIDELNAAAASIETAMGELPEYWEGASFDAAMSTYVDEYQTLLVTTVPEAVQSFKDYIQKCQDTILDVDAQLAGN